MEVSGRTKLCALIGDPVEHSLSPMMHNAAFKHLNLDFIYLAFRVEKHNLKAAIEGVRALKIHGLNVTKPLKVDVAALLDELDFSARNMGAVNTVLNQNGRLIGYNTDGVGALSAIQEAGVELEELKTVILGAGGASRAVAHSLANKVGELVILNRTISKAERLASELKKLYQSEVRYGGLDSQTVASELSDADLVINATSVGMKPNENASPINSELIRPDMVIFDLVYNPLETLLLRKAKEAGAKTISGLSMLLHQGAASFKIWTGVDAPLDVMRVALKKALGEYP